MPLPIRFSSVCYSQYLCCSQDVKCAKSAIASTTVDAGGVVLGERIERRNIPR